MSHGHSTRPSGRVYNVRGRRYLVLGEEEKKEVPIGRQIAVCCSVAIFVLLLIVFIAASKHGGGAHYPVVKHW
jgi:hypothetical protein